MNLKLIKNKEKGQAFEVYRLLIAFVIAVAVMSIIIVMVQKTNNESIILSTQNFEQGIISASKSPGTSSKIPFVISDLKLSGSITKKRISDITSLNKDCIFFSAGPGIEKTNLGVDIKQKSIKMNATVYCNFGNAEFKPKIIPYLTSDSVSDCSVFCVIFMNQIPPKEIYSN